MLPEPMSFGSDHYHTNAGRPCLVLEARVFMKLKAKTDLVSLNYQSPLAKK